MQIPTLNEFLKKSLDAQFKKPDREETGVPFVVAYHTRFHNLSAIVRKYFCMSERKLREFLHLLQLSHFVLLTV